MAEFTRTEYGLRNSHQFYSNPLVWVEGDDDVVYVGYALKSLDVVVKPANGKQNCDGLIEELFENNAPHVVVLDGDYELLTQSGRRRHRRLVVLERYSIENYLFELDVCENVCRMCAADLSGTNYMDGVLDELNNQISQQLRELIVLDAALCLANEDTSAFPNRIDALLEEQGKPTLDANLVERAAQDARTATSHLDLTKTEQSLNEFLKNRPLAHILRGHLLFGLLRFAISIAMQKQGGRKAPDDRSLRAIFASHLWDEDVHADHKRVRTKLIRGVRESIRLRTHSQN